MDQLAKSRSGITLIELLVVIGIMSILSAFSLAALNTGRAQSRDDKRIADLKVIQAALELYNINVTRSGRTDYPYPVRTDSSMLGIYNPDPNDEFRTKLAATPLDPVYANSHTPTEKAQYGYLAPACFHTGEGSTANPAVITAASSTVIPTVDELKAGTSATCPRGMGWLPYALFGILERPQSGSSLNANRSQNLIQQTDSTKSTKMVAYSSRLPIYNGVEIKGARLATMIKDRQSYCFPARQTVSYPCPDGVSGGW